MTAAAAGPVVLDAVTEPGVYDLPADVYHADPVLEGSLSVSGARLLLPPSCPARFAWERQQPPQPTVSFDVGHAAHMLVLGNGPDIVLIDAEDWRTKAAKEQRDAVHAEGKTPLLRAEHEQVHGMATVLARHPVAGLLFAGGMAEQSLFWVDEQTGVWRRARPDWMPTEATGRFFVVDYKTTKSASPELLGKHAADYGYHMQAAWYLDGVRAVGLADDPVFIFVFQEKIEPYLVTVAELDAVALRIGRDYNRRALEIYRDCTEAGVWPGYSNEVELVSLPLWVTRRHAEELWT